MAYVLTGQGTVGPQRRPVRDKELVVFGAGDNLTIQAAERITGGHDALDVLLLGGLPIQEPIASYGPFVMNSEHEIAQAIDDLRHGRLGIVPAAHRAPRRYS